MLFMQTEAKIHIKLLEYSRYLKNYGFLLFSEVHWKQHKICLGSQKTISDK